MRNRLFLLISTLICIISTSTLSAQNNFIISTSGINPSSINTCQGVDTFRFRMLNQTAGILTGVQMTYSLPAGVTYVSSFTNSPGTLSEVDVTDLNNPILGFSDMASGDNPLIEIVTQSSCGVVGQVTLTNGITITTTSNGDVDTGVSPTYVPNNPSIITSADINTVNAQFGQTYNRIYTLEESGNGFLTEALFERTFGDAYTVDSLLLVTGGGDVNIPFTVIPGAGTTDTIRIAFSNADLIAAGITDGTFDQGDQFQIREVITVVDCDGNNAGQAVGYWGCGPDVCEKVNPISVGILFGSFQPNLNIIDRSPEDLLGILPPGQEQHLAYGCGEPYEKAVLLENVGNETANNIVIDLYNIDPQVTWLELDSGIFYQVGLNGPRLPVDSFVLTNSWTSATEVSNIAFGGPVPRRVNIYISEPIEAGDSLFIIHSQISVPNDNSTGLYGCTTGSQGYVINRTRIQGLVYTDACGTGNIVEGSQGDENYNYNRLVVGQGTSPTIVLGNGPGPYAAGTTEFIANSAVLDGHHSIAGSLGALDSTAYMDFKFNLPDGLDYAGDPLNPADGNFELIGADGSTMWIPDTLIVTDSSFIARYFLNTNPRPAGFGWTTNTAVNFSYVPDCTEITQPACPAPQINPSVTIEKEFYVVPTTQSPTCTTKLYLDCIQVTDPIQVYCSACPCPLGVQYVDANIVRTSLGNPDNDLNGIVDTLANGDIQPQDSLDFNEIKVLNFIEGDTLTGYYDGYVNTTLGAAPAADTVPVMPYMYGYITTPNVTEFIGLTASAVVYDASTGVEHVSTIPLPTFNESNSIFVDLSGDVLIATAGMTPPLPASFVYEDTDSIRFDMDMRAIRDVGNVELTTDFELVIFGSDSIYPSNVPSNRRFVCIPPGVNQRRLKQFGWREDKSGTTTLLVSGCESRILFNFANNVLWSTGWTNPFPYEHRRLFNIPEMRFNLPDGFSIVGDSVEIYSYRNNPLGTNLLTVFDAPYEIIAGGDSVRVYNIEVLNETGPAGDIRSNGPMQINVRPEFQASCEVADGSLNTILTRPRIGYNQEQFAGLRDSIAVSTREPTIQYNINYSAPQINAIAASPIVNAIQQVATWEVNFQNLAAVGNDAYNTWFYFDNALSGGQIDVDSVRDIATDSTYYPTVNGFFQLDSLNGATTKQFEVMASFTNCNLECIEWSYGYNCPSYIMDPSNPLFSLPSCKGVDTLCIQPNEALWQAAEITGLDSTDLCVPNTLEFEFTNVQTGHSYNTAVRIDMPLNSFVDIGSVFIEYPSGGTTLPVPASAIQFNAPGEYIVYIDSVFDSLNVQGLPGPLTSGQNNFRITYDVEFGCDYISGSGINTSVFGQNACGSATNEAGAPNQIVYIFGVPEPYFINPRVSANDSLNACNTDLTVRINMLKFGSNGIGANDSMRLTLPLGASYVPGSIVFLNNPLPQTEPTLDTIGNVVLNSWLLPTGVAELDSIDFTIDLAIGDSIDCGTPGILVQTFVDNTAFCVTLGANCGVKAQTGSRAFDLNVIRPTITVDNSGAAVLIAGATNVYQLDAQFENMDMVNDIPAGLTYDVYCADASGMATGPIIFTGTTSAIAAGDSVMISEGFSSPTLCSVADGLALVFQRSPANCLCDGSFLVPLSLLENIIAVDDADTTMPSTPIDINVLANDSSFTSTFDTASVAEVDAPMNGTTMVNADGTITYTPNDGFSGTDMFTYVVCAQEIAVNCDTATVTIYVPNTTTSKDDINSTLVDTPVSGSVVTNDGDPQSDNQLVNPTPVVMPINGMVTLLPNGNYTYTPNPGFSGQDEFQYEICDDGTPVACDTSTVYITIEPRPIDGNNPPIAEQDIATTEVDVPVTLSLLSNDSEIDGDSIIINTTPLTPPSNGGVVIGTDGSAVYTPNPGFIGTDTFEYIICDPFGLCDTTEAIITIIDDVANEVFANDDAGAGLQDMPISGSMIANDSDPEGDVYFVNDLNPITDVANGSVVINNDGTYVYTPNPGYTGPDQFTYELCDNGTPQACDTATVYLTVLPAPNSTEASNDINSTPQDIAVAGNVLTNDNDDEGDNQSVNPTPLSPTMNGTVSLFPNGSYVYTPNPGFTGEDQFTYEVCDDATPQACDTATVFITVVGNPMVGNNPPVANEDEGTTEVDTPVDGSLLSNDSDPDGDSLVVNTTPLTPPSNGGVVINPDGTYTYNPDPGFVGVDTFEYIICDFPGALCDTTVAIITIIEDEGNETFTQDDAGTGLQDQPILGNISDNDSDPEGDVQSVNTTPLSGPSNGTVTILPDGSYTYNPNPGFSGNDQFVYNVCDNGTPIACDTATVYLTVLPPFSLPIVAVDDSAIAVTEIPVNINVIANDTADAGFDNTSLAEVVPPMNGVVSYNPDGTVDYTSNPGFFGIDSFDYVICDLLLTCDTATVYVTVTPGPNNPPNAMNDDTTTLEDTPVVIDPLTNDTDLDGPLDSTSVTIVTPPNDAMVTVDPVTGEMTVTPDPNFTGVITYQYEVCDTATPPLCDIATVTVTIIPAPDTVVVSTPEDSTINLCTDTTVNFNDPISGISICGAPMNGTITPSFIPCLDYTPNMDYVGPDTLCVVTCAGTVCDTTIFVIDVTPVNDPPVALDDDTTTLEDTPVVIDPLTNDTDLEGPLDSTTVTEVTPPMNGSITIDPATGEITYTPDPNFVGVDEFTYAVCDTGAPVLCDTAVVTITITSSPDTIYVSVPEDSMVTVCTDTSVNFADPITSITLCAAPMNGTVVPSILPCVDYSPVPDYVGPDTMCIVTCSGVFCDTTIVVIDVTPTNDPPTAVDNDTSTLEDTPVTVDVLDNDFDLDGPIDTASVTVVTTPMNGMVTNNGDGTITYTPDPNFVGVDMYTYAVCDTGLPVLCDTAVVTITITSTPDTINVTVPEDSMVTICTDTSVNFQDPITSISICNGADNGTTVPSTLPCVVYTPVMDYVGPDTMCIVTCSGVFCDTTIVIIDVTPVNDPPVAVDDDTTTLEDTPVVIDPLTNDTDLEGPLDSTSVTEVTPPMNGSITIDPVTGEITYTPDADFVGTDMFTYAVCDTGAPVLCDTALVTVTITSAPDTTLLTLPEDSMIVLCTDSLTNFAGPITSISLCGAPSNGAITQEFLPCVTYTPNPDYWGPDTTCLITCAGSVCDTTYVFITVTPIIDVPVLDPVEDICETEPIPALTGTSEAGSVIQWIENGVIIGTGSPFTPPAVPGENCYQAVAFNATLGLTSPDTAEVCFNIDSLPTNVSAGPDDTICGFQDYELQATGNGRLVFWTQIVGQQVSLDLSNPNAIAALEPNNTPGTDNIYTFAWTNTNGLCTVSDTVTIWVTNPHFTDAGNDTTVCIPEAGGSVQLNATLTPGATGWWNYVGSGNITFVDSTDAQTVVDGLIPYVNPTSTYLFEWFEQIDSCIAKDEVIITVNEAPGLTVAAADTFCLGTDYILNAGITGISQASYSWRLDGPTGTILSWDEDAVVSPLVNTTYYVVASVAFGQNFCTTSDSLELFVDGLPIAVDDGCFDLFEDSLLTGSTNDWLLNDDLTAVLTGNVGFEVLNGGSVLDPASTIVIDNVTDTYVYTPFPDMSGVDSATIVIFNEACPHLRDTFIVCFNVIPVTDDPIVAMPDTFNIVAGTTVTFPILDNDTLNGQAVDTVITILLDPIYGSIDTPIVDGQVVYNSETEFASVDSFQYIVCQYLVDGEELCDTTTVIVLVDGILYIPEGFTPNSDGVNDVFEIPNIELLYPNATMQIFNRWGDEVYNSQGPYRNTWDGTNFNGNQLVDGTYFYIVKLNNGSDRSMASFVVIYR